MSFSISGGFRRIAGLAILGLLAIPIVFVSSAQSADAESVIAQIGADIDGEAAGDEAGYSVALNSDGTIVAIGAWLNDGANGTDSGQVRVYQYSGGSWAQLGSDIDGEAAQDTSGRSVALSADGTRLAIGADNNDGANGVDSGHVRVYDWDGSSWTQAGSDIDGEAASDFSGISTALSSDGTRLAIGAFRNDGAASDAGHVRVYDWDGSSWTQAGSDIDGEAASDLSGYRLALSSDGTRVAIGAYGNDGNGSAAGHVRVYDWDGSSWTQAGSDIDGEAAGDGSGTDVALSSDGSRLAIVADGNDNANGTDSGHTRVYDWDGSSWTQTGADIDGEAAGNYSFSADLSSNGNRIAIGAYGNADNGADSGHVRVYDWDGSSWTQTGPDIDGEAAGDYSGWAVDLSADGARLAVGAFENNGINGAASGHVRVFSITSSTSSSSTTTGTSNSQTNSSNPGIFLTVHGQSGDAINGSEVRFGAYSIQPSSPYVVTIRSGNDITTQRILASGKATQAGHLDRTITLPALPVGNHTVVLNALNASGQQLILGNTITVSANQTVSTTTPENLQPSIR